MDVKSELLFFFSALGAFNGILLSLYFILIARPKHISNIFLGGFLLSLSIRIGKSVFLYFVPEIAMGFRQLGLTGCFFIGPFLYLYIRSINKSHDFKDQTWKLHLFTLGVIATIVGFLYPYEGNADLWNTVIVRIIYYIWLFYTVLAGVELLAHLKKVKKDGGLYTRFEVWILSIYIGNLLIWLSYYFVGWSSYILGALLFSFMFYLLVLLLIFTKRKESILYRSQPRYNNKVIGAKEGHELRTKLQALMENEQLYLNPNLKLADVAKRLNVLPHTLSQLLNANMEVGFSTFVNQWRIEEAKNLMVNNKNHKLEAISFECGFNSASTFYTTFKKLEGLTPAKYRESLLKF